MKKGTVLGDVELPDVDGGYYYWYTAKTTVINESGDYKVCYKPNDITNYDWTENPGWSNAHKGIIVTVKITVQSEHAHTLVWKSDAAQHWQECECGEKTEKAAHTFNAGEITKAPTTTATGIKTYECEVCGYQKQEVLPKKEDTTPGKPTPTPDKPTPTPDKPTPTPDKPVVTDISKAASKTVISGIKSTVTYTGKTLKQSKLTVTVNGKKLSAKTDYTVKYKNNKNIGKATITITGKGNYKGTVKKTFQIKVSKKKAYVVEDIKYKVTKDAKNGKGTVKVVGSTKKTNKKYKKLKIANTVQIGGVTYKITAIEKKAFANYKYLTSVQIGDKVTKISDQAFYGCKALTNIEIGKSVTTIGKSSFAKCKKLKQITFKTKKLNKVGKKAFKGINKKVVVNVPKKQYKKYVSLMKKGNVPSKVTYKKVK